MRFGPARRLPPGDDRDDPSGEIKRAQQPAQPLVTLEVEWPVGLRGALSPEGLVRVEKEDGPRRRAFQSHGGVEVEREKSWELER